MDADLVATLICHPGSGALDMAAAEEGRRAVGGLALYALADGVAYDIPLPAQAQRDAARTTLREHFSDAPVDIAVQTFPTRRKKLLIADMDSTIIEQECIDELADLAGVGERVADITARAMRGELAFEPAMGERLSLLAGLPAAMIERTLKERITIRSGARELVSTMRANGAYCALVSGGFTSFTGAIAAAVGFDMHRANVLEMSEGRLTGGIEGAILGREAKARTLHELIAARGLEAAETLAVGDGANDLDMLLAAGTGVALHAKPIVARQADIRIDHGDLTALLYLQGYRRADFAA